MLGRWPHTYRGAVLAFLPPVPVLGEMPVRTGLALCGHVGSAVSFHRCARWALVTREERGCRGVTVLVRWLFSLLLKGPGERSCQKLQEKESKSLQELTQQQ